ncbi:PREDICTED: uncharacterized protein LOC105146412 [Acromyrmex echinatior]|uniref:uncharacterized protein LOC105146412 n=1 Tax=Acromyrmex echinatior TaxID=103372 RepID=UPI000580F2DB|nr:PREDICTED: uncharacterized protein LOC105146412 [Acromyrmex echinatior]
MSEIIYQRFLVTFRDFFKEIEGLSENSSKVISKCLKVFESREFSDISEVFTVILSTFVLSKGDISFVHFCRTTNFSSLLIDYRIERSEDLSVLYCLLYDKKRINEVALQRLISGNAVDKSPWAVETDSANVICALNTGNNTFTNAEIYTFIGMIIICSFAIQNANFKRTSTIDVLNDPLMQISIKINVLGAISKLVIIVNFVQLST